MQLTDNLDVEDKLCNGSEGNVKYIHICTSNSCAKDGGTIYVQFDNEKSGKKKLNFLPDKLQSCVPILVSARKFSYSLLGKNKKSNLIFCERKEFPIALAHAKTIHKSQGSTIDHMAGDLDTTPKGGKQPCSTSRELFYALPSRFRRRDLIQILNFHEDKIKHNNEALKDIERVGRDCLFVYEHPLEKLLGNKICLNNTIGWQDHFFFFLISTIPSIVLYFVLLGPKLVVQE